MTKEEKLRDINFYCASLEGCEMCNIGKDSIAYALCESKGFLNVEKWTDKEVDYLFSLMQKEEEPENKNGKSVFSDKKTFTGTLIIEPAIKDSGNRREFETGAVRDMQEGKGRMDLLPWAAIIEVSKHCEAGAKKYGEHNIDKGIPTNSLCDSAARHLAKYLDGWKDENHLLAAAWNLLWCIEMTIKKPEMVNTPFEIKVSKREG